MKRIPDERQAPMTEITNLTPRHSEIMERLLERQALAAIGEQMGIAVPYLRVIIQSPLFRAELRRRRETRDRGILDRMEALSKESLDVLRYLMRNGLSEDTKFKCSIAILDRAGYSKLEKKVQIVADAETVIRELNRRLGGESLEASIVKEEIEDATDHSSDAGSVDADSVQPNNSAGSDDSEERLHEDNGDSGQVREAGSEAVLRVPVDSAGQSGQGPGIA